MAGRIRERPAQRLESCGHERQGQRPSGYRRVHRTLRASARMELWREGRSPSTGLAPPSPAGTATFVVPEARSGSRAHAPASICSTRPVWTSCRAIEAWLARNASSRRCSTCCPSSPAGWSTSALGERGYRLVCWQPTLYRSLSLPSMTAPRPWKWSRSAPRTPRSGRPTLTAASFPPATARLPPLFTRPPGTRKGPFGSSRASTASRWRRPRWWCSTGSRGSRTVPPCRPRVTARRSGLIPTPVALRRSCRTPVRRLRCTPGRRRPAEPGAGGLRHRRTHHAVAEGQPHHSRLAQARQGSLGGRRWRRRRAAILRAMCSRPKSCSASWRLWARQRRVRFAVVGGPPLAKGSTWWSSS